MALSNFVEATFGHNANPTTLRYVDMFTRTGKLMVDMGIIENNEDLVVHDLDAHGFYRYTAEMVLPTILRPENAILQLSSHMSDSNDETPKVSARILDKDTLDFVFSTKRGYYIPNGHPAVRHCLFDSGIAELSDFDELSLQIALAQDIDSSLNIQVQSNTDLD